MANRTITLLTILASLCIIAVAQDDVCVGLQYCGFFCCPGGRGLGGQCCEDSAACCDSPIGEAPTPAFCGSNLASCPDSLPPSEVYDDNDQLRNQCCSYFRSGCCSKAENDTLNLLFYLAIGLGAGLFALLLIIILIVVCICSCVYCC